MQKQEEFIRIITKHEGVIYKVARVYSDGEEEPKDLYQEIVFQLWKSFDSFRGESSLNTWIYRVALNTAITLLNRKKRRPASVELDFSHLTLAEASDPVLEERIQLLYDTIKTLNPIEKGIILLYLEGKSYDEMAGITGFTATNIGTRLGRIRKKLKSHMIKQ